MLGEPEDPDLCEDKGLLTSLFSIEDFHIPIQYPIDSFARLFDRFHQHVLQSGWPAVEITALGRAAEVVCGRAPLQRAVFYVSYGCVILCRTSIGCSSGVQVHLELLALDQWTYEVSREDRSASTGCSQHGIMRIFLDLFHVSSHDPNLLL
jgi:hypothetical protein